VTYLGGELCGFLHAVHIMFVLLPMVHIVALYYSFSEIEKKATKKKRMKDFPKNRAPV
jgi:hypothetical protein